MQQTKFGQMFLYSVEWHRFPEIRRKLSCDDRFLNLLYEYDKDWHWCLWLPARLGKVVGQTMRAIA